VPKSKFTPSEVRRQLIARNPDLAAVFAALPKSKANRILRNLAAPARLKQLAGASELSMLAAMHLGPKPAGRPKAKPRTTKLTHRELLAAMKRQPGGADAVATVRAMPAVEQANMLDLIADLQTRPPAAQRLAVAFVAGSLSGRAPSPFPPTRTGASARSSIGARQRKAIRALYLNPRLFYPIEEILAAFPAMTEERILADVESDARKIDGHVSVAHEAVMTFGLVNWSGNPLGVILALGDDLPRVSSRGYLLAPSFSVRLPRYIMTALRAIARDRGQSVEEALVAELFDVAAGLGGFDSIDTSAPPRLILDPTEENPWKKRAMQS
jgi:hypothetical protein